SVKDAIQYAQQVLGDDFISVQMYDSLVDSSSSSSPKIIRLTTEGAERFHSALKVKIDQSNDKENQEGNKINDILFEELEV
ncbi:hypothetical protein ABTE70_20285, partial [Acinetobacter baumannii]